MSISISTTVLIHMADNNRYAPVLASSNRTGATFGNPLELQNRRMTLMAPTE